MRKVEPRVSNSPRGAVLISKQASKLLALGSNSKLKRESEPSKEFGGEIADGTRQKSTFELGKRETKTLSLLEQMKNDLKVRMH